jgi:hypothetical protein
VVERMVLARREEDAASPALLFLVVADEFAHLDEGLSFEQAPSPSGHIEEAITPAIGRGA